MSGLVSGIVGMRPPAPAQPGVLAYNSATDTNVTGYDINHTCDFDTEVYDQGGNFLNDVFTAPVTGRYFITATVRLEGLNTNIMQLPLRINASNEDYFYIFNNQPSSGVTNQAITVTNIIDMDANDTVYIQLQAQGVGSNAVDVIGQGVGGSHTAWISIMMVA